MRITGVRTFVVGNPTPGYGGRYFIFLKLESDGGLEGLGEVYAATVSPHLVASMVEDVVARHVVGREPFHIEATWRDVYASGYAMRPDPTLVGVLSGIEMAMWDLAGKAVGKPAYELLGGRVRERLRCLQLPLRARPATRPTSTSIPTWRPPCRRVRRPGLHGAQVRSGRAVRVLRSPAAVARRSRSLRALRRADPGGRRLAL